MRNCKKISKTCISSCFIIISLLVVAPLYAEPAQRIIVHFNKSLSVENSKEMFEYVSGLHSDNYSLAEHSSNLRWIIVLNSKLEQPQLNSIYSGLLKNKLVKHVEIDNVLARKSITSNP